MQTADYDFGMVGLGVMGRNLTLNMSDHGFSVAGFDLDANKIKAMNEAAQGREVMAVAGIDTFVRSLQRPRAIMMLVPAGPAVDAVIQNILPFLEKGDLVIDGGNSYYKDTKIRGFTLAEKGILYLGVGISGGEHGARHGPSLMPGGPREGYERVKGIFESIAARVDGQPCVAYLGPGASGHYVKMIHNGLEYGLMQLIAETYDLLKRGFDLTDDELHDVYADWSSGELSSYLLEITAEIFSRVDEKTGKRLVDEILDEAKQKGTGKWTAQDAMDLQVPIPTIDMAVGMRDLSIFKEQRKEASALLNGSHPRERPDRAHFLKQLKNAFYAAMVLTFTQGMALLRVASATYDFRLDLSTIARIWRGGCIIRAALLEQIQSVYAKTPDLANLLLEPSFGKETLERRVRDLRTIVKTGIDLEIAVPAFMASLGYYDGYRSAWSPANLIQAQRDYFGAHTYERVDEKGAFHTDWEAHRGDDER